MCHKTFCNLTQIWNLICSWNSKLFKVELTLCKTLSSSLKKLKVVIKVWGTQGRCTVRAFLVEKLDKTFHRILERALSLLNSFLEEGGEYQTGLCYFHVLVNRMSNSFSPALNWEYDMIHCIWIISFMISLATHSLLLICSKQW